MKLFFFNFSLGPLVNKVKESQAEYIIDTLCSNILSNDEILKETSSLGLKTIILGISPESHHLISIVCKITTNKLLTSVIQVLSFSLVLFL